MYYYSILISANDKKIWNESTMIREIIKFGPKSSQIFLNKIYVVHKKNIMYFI